MRRWLAAVCVALLASSAAATQRPEKIAIGPVSPRGAIIFATPPLPVEYIMMIAPFDPVARKVGTNGAARIEIRPGRGGGPDGDLFISDLNPGTYVVALVSQQGIWGLCYANNTLQFTVAAGEIVYLGSFDGAAAIRELHGLVARNGHQRVRNSELHHYIDGVSAVPLAGADDAAALTKATGWLRAASPQTSATPRPAVLSPAGFGKSYTLFGEKACVSWFNQAEKPKP